MLSGTMSPATPVSLHPGLVTERFTETCEFYCEHFGFSPLEITAEFAMLGRRDGARLSVLQARGEGQPAALQRATRGAGVWLALDCEDVDSLHSRLAACGVEVVVDPEYTLAGARRCVVRDPNGVLIYLKDHCAVSPAVPELSSKNPIHIDHHEDHSDCVHRLSRH